jgi:hypothetical protein
VLYPLLEKEDKETIQNIFRDGVIALRKEGQKRFKKIESKRNLRKFDKLLTAEEMMWFLRILNNQKVKIYDPEYSGYVKFNETPDEDDKYIRSVDNRNLDTIKILTDANRLKNRYIEKNLSKIKKVYIEVGKLNFINQKIIRLLYLKQSYAEIDSKKLESVLKKIKIKNDKKIKKLLKSLNRFPQKQLDDEYQQYIQEIKEQQELRKCEKLIYWLAKAKRSGNKESISELQHQIFEMKINPEKKHLMEVNAEKRLNEEEAERLSEIAESERKLSEISKEKSELSELRDKAIRRLITNSSAENKDKFITEDGKMLPLILDKESNEEKIDLEIPGIPGKKPR